MVKKRTLIILLIFLGIAIIHGLLIEHSMNLFFSWLLIGFWIFFTIKFFQKIKDYREFNSPKNTSFFLLGPLALGLFYNFWGYFTGLLGQNLLEAFIPSLYISPWTLIFSFPYILYGLFSLYSCYKKYDVVYLISTRSLNARKFGIFFTILILFSIIYYVIFFNVIISYLNIIVLPIYFYFDLMLLIVGIFLVFLFIRYGIFGAKRSLPEISPEYIARRRSRIESISTSPTRSSSPRQTTPSAFRSATRSQTTPSTSRSTPRRQPITSATRSKPRRQTTTSVSRPAPRGQRVVRKPSFEKLKPKAGILSLEDFKCIFCFKLPQLPADQGRGIIICPNCRHPAHANEFKDWSKRSHLCSRCDAPIPPSFFRNPKIIPVKEYLEVIKEFSKRNR